MKIKTYKKILQLLQDGKFHSGELLAQSLNITRSAVWKNIQLLETFNIDIESINGKGYQLKGGIELLDDSLIKKELNSKNLNHLSHLELLEQTASTNDHILECFRQHTKMPMVCLAEQQTQGRGRRGRQWISPFGNNIYCSLGWHFDKDPVELMGLSLVAGLAIIRTLKRYGFTQHFQLKWPNDLLWNNQKLGGVLTEIMGQSHASTEVIIGIGINTLLSKDANTLSIDQPYTDLQTIFQKKIHRNRLAGILIDELMTAISQFEINGLSYFINEWNEYDAYYKKPVKLITPSKTIEGIAEGVGAQGELLLSVKQQQLRFYSGEISLRGNETNAKDPE